MYSERLIQKSDIIQKTEACLSDAELVLNFELN